MFGNYSTGFRLPPAIKNLLILNILFFLGAQVFQSSWKVDLNQYLALHYFGSEYFKPYQYITYMFMHADFFHIFFNMYALWMFGKVLEIEWGTKRFLIYYFITGVGAAALHTLITWWSMSKLIDAQAIYLNTPSQDAFSAFVSNFFPEDNDRIYKFIKAWMEHPADKSFLAETQMYINNHVTGIMNVPMLGASGAVFGILLAFGMTYPNAVLMLLFPPIPIKAKYLVIIYGGIEFYFAIFNQPGDNVAHFAHLGGMLFGFILIRYWKKKQFNRWQ
ncbi:MAG: rhomboid family intramembrane serine protease [Bacteroidia bacterium]|nr:rhomboid family intramembrane serine protease [Bacteroidia bacterium]